MSERTVCEMVRADLPLFLYGELDSEAEDRLEEHVFSCAECRREMETWKATYAVLDRAVEEPPAELLTDCRRALREGLTREVAPGWWGRFRSAVLAGGWLKPASAVALVAAGFFAARVTSAPGLRWQGGLSPAEDVVASRVRMVEPDPSSGGVRIMIEETKQRMVTGAMDDEPIRKLLLAAAKDPADPGLRVDTIDLLKQRPEEEGVRGALLAALQGDPNAGVRLKALEGLRPYAAEPAVRQVLAQALLQDDNPGIRTQAIDLLTQTKQRDMVDVLQQLMRREENGYIRLRTQRALREMNASLDTF